MRDSGYVRVGWLARLEIGFKIAKQGKKKINFVMTKRNSKHDHFRLKIT